MKIETPLHRSVSTFFCFSVLFGANFCFGILGLTHGVCVLRGLAQLISFTSLTAVILFDHAVLLHDNIELANGIVNSGIRVTLVLGHHVALVLDVSGGHQEIMREVNLHLIFSWQDGALISQQGHFDVYFKESEHAESSVFMHFVYE